MQKPDKSSLKTFFLFNLVLIINEIGKVSDFVFNVVTKFVRKILLNLSDRDNAYG